ncbi:MAG TPA: thioredoxin domain-containing protein [Pyrinomonadaceae bacterium]|nr:thioredoxin domain-containing protein [Pyrinomonadaceae bacterium]
MKLFFAILLLFLGFNVFAQTSEGVLATANNQTFTSKDLAPSVREAFENLPKLIAEKRKELLEQQIAGILLDAESTARKTTVEKLIQKEVYAKIPNPTDAQVQAVFDANRAAIGDKIIKEVRPQIVVFLRRDLEQKAFADYISTLKTKYKISIGRDVNMPNLAASDILATVGGKPLSVDAFEAKNALPLYEIKAEIYDQTRDTLEQLLFSTLLVAEAKSQNIQASDLIAREVTDKMREFADTEREQLQNDLRKRLFQKYNAKVLLKDPLPVAQNISTEGSPSKGKTDAPLTVVMFTDFQCSHCAAAHPVLQKVMAGYAGKIRFVVRNYPLESIHENAFRAALAANAAHAQGKFFEYTEILYNNQNNLNEVSLKKYAAQIGLIQKQFDLDLGSEKSAAAVRRDLQDGVSYGVAATPTVFVNGVKARANSAQDFRRAIERALKK